MSGQPGTVFHISSTPWHFTWQTAQQLSEQWVQRGWRVRFIDPLPKRIPSWREYRRVWGRLRGDPVQGGKFRQQTIDGVTVIPPLALPDRGALSRWLNRKWFLPQVARHLLIGAIQPSVAVVTLPTQAALDLLDLLHPDLLIYAGLLNFTQDPHAPPDIGKTECELVARADLVLADQGQDNQTRIASYGPTVPVLHYTASVPYDLFEPARAPRTPRPAGERPRCCYFGDVRANVDVDLLRRVSQQYQLRLVGCAAPPGPGFDPRTEYVAPVPYVDLPPLLRDADVLLLPYRQDDRYNAGVFPAKTYECLATGKPVVSIGLSSLSVVGDVVGLASDADDFMGLIERAAAPGSDVNSDEHRAARLAVAREHDRTAVYNRLFAEFERALNARLQARGQHAR